MLKIRKCLPVLLFLFFSFSAGAYEDGIRIAWDYRECKFQTGGVYARIKQLRNGDLVLVYSQGTNVYIKKKPAGDRYWGIPVNVAGDVKGLYNYTNSELIELESGRLLYAWNARPKISGSVPYKIMIKASDDGGKTWNSETDVYMAGNTPEYGCWEPVFLQLPSGELQLYFANEFTVPVHDQNITMLRSFDGGQTWGEPEVVCYRKGSRDGMPVPVYLQENKGIVLAIEDNGIEGFFKPVIIHTAVEDNWKSGTVTGIHPSRWHALRSDYRLPSDTYAGAPYLIQLSGKETLLSVQSTEGRNTPWTHDHSIMQVYIGDSEAKNFSRKSTPFAFLPASANALWNALCQVNDSTVMAVSSIGGLSENNGIWTASGKIIRPMEIQEKQPGSREWEEKEQVFIGSRSQANLRAFSAWDKDSLYFLFEVNDKLPTVAEDEIIWNSDGVELYLDPENKNTDFISPGIYNVSVNIKEELSFRRSHNGIWEVIESRANVTVNEQMVGYTIRLSVPRVELGGLPVSDFGIHMRLHNNDKNTTIVHEDLSGGHPNKPSTWLKCSLIRDPSTGMVENRSGLGESLLIYPNPVKKGESFKIEWQPGEVGITGTEIKIYDLSSGKNLLYKTEVSGESCVVDKLLFSGVAGVVVTTRSGKRITGKIIIN